MILLCGLGNPGDKYKMTRHNAGFLFIDHLAKQHGASEFKEKWDAWVAEASINGRKCLLIKPKTFMNLSGKAVAKFMNFYKIDPSQCYVAYDDVDLPLGSTRIRKKGGPGTHNGMKSIIECIGTQDFPRLRIGIESRGEHAPEQMDISSFVLTPFTEKELEILNGSIETLHKDFQDCLKES